MASKPSSVSFSEGVTKDFQPVLVEIVGGIRGMGYTQQTRAYSMTECCVGKLFTLTITRLNQIASDDAALIQQDSGFYPNTVLIPIEQIEDIVRGSAATFLKAGNLFEAEKTDHKSNAPFPSPSTGAPAPKPFGLEIDQQKACIERASTYVTDWFKSKCQSLSNGVVQKRVWEVSTTKILRPDLTQDPELRTFILQKLGCIREEAPVAFTAQDLQNFGVAPGEKTVNAAKISCFAFALLRTGEVRAKKEIFFGEAGFPVEKWPALLKEWGYTIVPAPKDRDLVMYFTAKGEVTHLGRYMLQKVQSKLGASQPYIHFHNIFDVPPHFGNVVLFWRPPVKKA